MKLVLKVDKSKYYPVRAGNNLTELRQWVKWAEKNSGNQKFILYDLFKDKSISKENMEYFKRRIKGGFEERYTVYGSY
jgi:hypothetical protein